MRTIAIALILVPICLIGYTFVVYPFLLMAWTWLRRRGASSDVAPIAEPLPLPMVTVVLPCYNGAAVIDRTLKALLAADYPADRRQVIVVSDASTDETSTIVRGFANDGVELLQLPERGGKTAAENYAAPHIRGDIVVCMDATSVIDRQALRALVSALCMPGVGIASGTDRSIDELGNGSGEALLTRWEMWIRSVETRAGVSVGASGCLYAMRRVLFDGGLHPTISRDFSAVLRAFERGWRCVSVPGAICYLETATSLRVEFRRKHRTMAQGLLTLRAHARLLDPVRHARIAIPLLSHKVCRWLVPPALAVAAIGVDVYVTQVPLGVLTLLIAALAAVSVTAGILWPAGRAMPRAIALLSFFFTACAAGIAAWTTTLRGQHLTIWNPTPRNRSLTAQRISLPTTPMAP